MASAPDPLAPRLRMYLQEIAGRAVPITYQALAKALQLLPPQTIEKVTNALERLIGTVPLRDGPVTRLTGCA